MPSCYNSQELFGRQQTRRMSTQLTVTLPDNVYERVRRLAELTGQDVEDAVTETLVRLLPPLTSEMDNRPIQSLTDQEVLHLADSKMDSSLNARMSALLAKQQAEPMTEADQAELEMLMEIYENGQAQKVEALVEATQRGLRKSGNL